MEPSEIIARAREAAKDRGAQMGLLHNQSSAYGCGEIGSAAIRSLLTDLRARRFEVIHGALRGEVVLISDLDALLREVDHAE